MKKNKAPQLPYRSQKIDVEALRQAMWQHLLKTQGKEDVAATPRDWLKVMAHTTRDVLTERWLETVHKYYEQDVKRVYYLSLEFLMGRALLNCMHNLDILQPCTEALATFGVSEEAYALEEDPALGNGGLGRLAACFMDSLSTLDLPGYGYGIRYEYGMFTQRLRNGWQVEHPDNWLRYGNPWEFARPEVLYQIRFGGRVIEYRDNNGRRGYSWVDTDDVMAMAYDTLVPGYGTDTVNTLRLWSAKASRDFHLQYFNEGNYIKAVEEKNHSENLSKVLYPDDTTQMGRELRLRQEYFFVSATVQDIIRRYLNSHDDIRKLPEKVAMQLNDTHPALAVPELMRLLLDIHRLEWDEAWDICVRCFAYTNHTLMPEALESWPVAMFAQILPRHLQIIYEINHLFLKEVSRRYPGDLDKLQRMSIIGEDPEKHVRMAHLAVVGSHKVNGVAALHTELMKSTLFADFHAFYPGKILNKTNGITPRRWLNQANPGLSELITSKLGTYWKKNLSELKKLIPLAEDANFRAAFRAVKQANKAQLAALIAAQADEKVPVDALFDVHIKRMHEYKRQLLNVFHVITRYNRIRANPQAPIVPRVVIFAGKAAPGYHIAKLVIKLINDVAEVINNDPLVGDKLKLVFLPNYDVSLAERIIPAADLSEQISTAGTEASGTGNMKLSLNGALTIGTLDGANIEIREAVGEENFFIFGLNSQEVQDLRARGYNPWDYYHAHGELKQVLDMLWDGFFSPEEPWRFRELSDLLLNKGDYYLVLADYLSYINCQQRVDDLFLDPANWDRKAILNVANMGKFSSDRTIKEYAEEIWDLKPVS
jgi:glycogen phosphorylase